MPNHYDERWEGPIRGLRLPLTAWNSLQEDGISSIDQLRAVAHQLESLPGIGAKTAQVIRAELARVSPAEG
jgi:DNA-directed RNA polymerase alpha subunit